MLAHKTWEKKDWQATDNEDKKGETVENEDEEPREENKKRRYKVKETIRKSRKGKQHKEWEARKIIGEGQNMTNIQEETQNERARQLQEGAEGKASKEGRS